MYLGNVVVRIAFSLASMWIRLYCSVANKPKNGKRYNTGNESVALYVKN